MIRYYERNKETLNKLYSFCEWLKNDIEFEGAMIRGNSTHLGFGMQIAAPYKSFVYGFNNKDLSIRYSYPCDSCDAEERKRYDSVINDERFQMLLRTYRELDPNALRIRADGVFIALGPPLRHRMNFELEGGIFIPFKHDFNRALVIKQIGSENAYLCDAVVH